MDRDQRVFLSAITLGPMCLATYAAAYHGNRVMYYALIIGMIVVGYFFLRPRQTH